MNRMQDTITKKCRLQKRQKILLKYDRIQTLWNPNKSKLY